MYVKFPAANFQRCLFNKDGFLGPMNAVYVECNNMQLVYDYLASRRLMVPNYLNLLVIPGLIYSHCCICVYYQT